MEPTKGTNTSGQVVRKSDKGISQKQTFLDPTILENRYTAQKEKRTQKENPSKKVKKQKLKFTRQEERQGLGTKEKRQTKKLNQNKKKLRKANQKIPTKHTLNIEKIFDEEKQKHHYKLHFEDEVKELKKENILTKGLGGIGQMTTKSMSKEVISADKDNVGVEALSKGKDAVTSSYRMTSAIHAKLQQAPYQKVVRLEKQAEKLHIKREYTKWLEENPKLKKGHRVSKAFQRRQIKKTYQEAYKAQKAAEVGQRIGTKVAQKIAELLLKNKKTIGIVALLALLLLLVMGSVSSCAILFTGSIPTTLLSAWLSDPKEIDKVALEYTYKEASLQNEIDTIEATHSQYDEYRYKIGSIEHDPFMLISYLSAQYEEFTYNQVSGELQALFDAQYNLVLTPKTERRSRPGTDPDTGESITVYYNYYILEVELKVVSLATIINNKLNDPDKKELYQAYLETKGGLQQLGSPIDYYWYYYVSSYYGY